MTGAFHFTDVMAWADAMVLAFIVCDCVTGTRLMQLFKSSKDSEH